MLSQVTREIRVEALPLEMPDRIELDVSAMEIGDSLRLSDLPTQRRRHLPRRPGDGARDGDGADEGRGARARGGRGGRGGRRGRGARGRGSAGGRGAEASAEGRGRGRRRARQPTRARPRAASSVGASAPRRSICSSRGSATRAASTPDAAQRRLDGRSTSSRGGTGARGARSSPASSRRCGSTARRLALRQARDVHERVRPLDRRRGASSSRRRRRRCSSSTTTSTSRRAACRRALGGGLAGHNGLRSIASLARLAGLPAPAGRRRDARAAATAARSPTTCSPRSTPETDVDALVARAADAVESIVREGLDAAQQRFN